MKLFAKNILEDGILLFTSTMTGVKLNWIFGEGFGGIIQNVHGFGVLRIQLHEMEAAHKDVRHEPLDNIQDALMRAAAYQDFALIVLNQKILFMPELIRNHATMIQHIHALVVGRRHSAHPITGIEGHGAVKL